MNSQTALNEYGIVEGVDMDKKRIESLVNGSILRKLEIEEIEE